jgi:hypothetical protein
LENGLISKTNSELQQKVNYMLDNLNVKFISEKSFTFFTVDNYLVDYKLIIENMGTYWHCDHRKYEKIIYENHVDRIKRDKSKHSYLKNNEDIEILYLWEEDVNNNIELCKRLIELYLKNNGVLDTYHSFNYILKNDILLPKDIIIYPYMDWEIFELNKIIDITIKEKRSRKQIDKWTIFSCDYCGEEKEQLASRYNKSNNHFCSYNCHNLFSKKNNKILPQNLLLTNKSSLND